MTKPTKTFIVTSSQMEEVVKTWEITLPDNEDAEGLAFDIAMECDEMGWKEYHRVRRQRGCVYETTKFDIKHIPCLEDIAQWSIKEKETDQ